MENDKFNRRRTYLISKTFQLKYTAIIVVFMFLISWLAGYTVYHTVFMLLGEKLANVYPQGRLIAIFKTVNFTLLTRTLLLLPFSIILSILLSHKVAGPVFRMERYLSEVARGNLSSVLKLRKRDELQNLAGAINKMTHSLGKIAKESQDNIAELSIALNEINVEVKQPVLNKDKISNLAKEAIGQMDSLKQSFSQYHLGESA